MVMQCIVEIDHLATCRGYVASALRHWQTSQDTRMTGFVTTGILEFSKNWPWLTTPLRHLAIIGSANKTSHDTWRIGQCWHVTNGCNTVTAQCERGIRGQKAESLGIWFLYHFLRLSLSHHVTFQLAPRAICIGIKQNNLGHAWLYIERQYIVCLRMLHNTNSP